jgi:N-acetylglucosamine-6-phosphate deacetylase
MPSRIRSASPRHNGITKLTNCRLLRGDELVWDDVWVSSVTGTIIRSQSAFYDELIMPDEVVDLGGRIVSPGFIECQLNGAYGFNFSTDADDMAQYAKQLRDLNKKLAQTGVTSYIPTVTSQASQLYKKVGSRCLYPTKSWPSSMLTPAPRSCPISAPPEPPAAPTTAPSPSELTSKAHF